MSVPVGFLGEASDAVEHPVKGGLKIKDYLTYNWYVNKK